MAIAPTFIATDPVGRRAWARLRHGRMPRRKAMTLIEILVVVGIIAVLIAILLPALSRARQQVQGVSCRSNIRQLANGAFFYVADHKVMPGTHSLFYFQQLFGWGEWPRLAGVTWDGARDRLVGLSLDEPSYTTPHHLDQEFIADVPGKGTIYRYVKAEDAYTCPADAPGVAEDSPLGGGGNGRLSYSLNAYIGYKDPDQLGGFTYVADSADNPLPGGQETRSFTAGQRVTISASRYMMLFEEHPYYHINRNFPEGNFNGIDRISTRHSPKVGSDGTVIEGRASIGFLDGHVESRIYPAKTEGRELFTEFGQPHFWRKSGGPDIANMSRFIPNLGRTSPW